MALSVFADITISITCVLNRSIRCEGIKRKPRTYPSFLSVNQCVIIRRKKRARVAAIPRSVKKAVREKPRRPVFSPSPQTFLRRARTFHVTPRVSCARHIVIAFALDPIGMKKKDLTAERPFPLSEDRRARLRRLKAVIFR